MKLLNLFPFLQTILDLAENSQLVSMASSFLENGMVSDTQVQLASILSIAKWVVSGIIFLAILIGIGMRVLRLLKSNNPYPWI